MSNSNPASSSPSSEHEELLKKYRKLQLDHEELYLDNQGTLGALEMKNADLLKLEKELAGQKEQHADLFNAHEALFVEHSKLTSKYDKLFASHQKSYVNNSNAKSSQDEEIFILKKKLRELSSPDSMQLRKILRGLFSLTLIYTYTYTHTQRSDLKVVFEI